MWHIYPTENWLDEVVKHMNEKQLSPEASRFMIAFFSSMDDEFVSYFQTNKNQISSFSGQNFHIFTPLIYEDKLIPDEDWRYMRQEFNSLGIPVGVDPTLVFFSLEKYSEIYEPNFFAGFTCRSFDNFKNKLRNAIETSIITNDTHLLSKKLSEIFLSKNIIPMDNVNEVLKRTITNKLPKSTIFISHSSKDKPFAKRLINELSQDKSLNFWIDEKEMLVGDDIQKSVTENLKTSDYLMLLISNNSINSPWVNFEVSQFIGFAEGKNIIPIIVSKGEKFSEPIDNLIRGLKYLDFTDEARWQSNIQELKQKFN